jgi:hypothetical protein
MDVGGQRHALAVLLPRERDRVPILQVAGWGPGRAGRMREISPSPAFDLRTVQPLVSHYTDSAIPVHG